MGTNTLEDFEEGWLALGESTGGVRVVAVGRALRACGVSAAVVIVFPVGMPLVGTVERI